MRSAHCYEGKGRSASLVHECSRNEPVSEIAGDLSRGTGEPGNLSSKRHAFGDISRILCDSDPVARCDAT